MRITKSQQVWSYRTYLALAIFFILSGVSFGVVVVMLFALVGYIYPCPPPMLATPLKINHAFVTSFWFRQFCHIGITDQCRRLGICWWIFMWEDLFYFSYLHMYKSDDRYTIYDNFVFCSFLCTLIFKSWMICVKKLFSKYYNYWKRAWQHWPDYKQKHSLTRPKRAGIAYSP